MPLLDLLKSLFTENRLVLLGLLWGVLGSTFIETRYVDKKYSGILSGGSTIIFAFSIFQFQFIDLIIQISYILLFFIIGIGYFISHFKGYFGLENELTLIFAGRQIGALQISFILAYIQGNWYVSNMLKNFISLLLFLNGASFIIRYFKNHASIQELPWAIFGAILVIISMVILLFS